MKKRHVDTAGEGKGRANLEIIIDIYTPTCVKQIAKEKLLYNTGSPAQLPVTT